MQIDEKIDDTDLRPNHIIDPTKYKGKYPITELEKIRQQLIHDIYDQGCIFLDEISVKRKCGLLTNEVLDFYINNKKPKDYKESFEIDPNDFEIIQIDNNNKNNSNNNNQHKNKHVQSQKSSSETNNNNISMVHTSPIAASILIKPPIDTPKVFELKKFDHSSPKEPPKLDINALNTHIKILSKTLNLAHGCELEKFKFCPSQILAHDVSSLNLTTIFICDQCQVGNLKRDHVPKHLMDSKHLSASEYYIDKQAYENIYIPNSKIKYIKSRACITNTNDFTEIVVVCPKCYFCFDKSVTACAIHYSLEHNADAYIYSVANLKRTEKITVEKAHSCFECGLRFKRLTDLTSHLTNAKHFPKNYSNQEIYILSCPFDKCSFRSAYFFSFKNHLLTHSFFQRKIDNGVSSVLVSYHVYTKPTSFFHVCSFGENCFEYNDEIKCIDAFLESIRGHTDISESSRKAKQRKDHLYKLMSSSNRISN